MSSWNKAIEASKNAQVEKEREIGEAHETSNKALKTKEDEIKDLL